MEPLTKIIYQEIGPMVSLICGDIVFLVVNSAANAFFLFCSFLYCGWLNPGLWNPRQVLRVTPPAHLMFVLILTSKAAILEHTWAKMYSDPSCGLWSLPKKSEFSAHRNLWIAYPENLVQGLEGRDCFQSCLWWPYVSVSYWVRCIGDSVMKSQF